MLDFLNVKPARSSSPETDAGAVDGALTDAAVAVDDAFFATMTSSNSCYYKTHVEYVASPVHPIDIAVAETWRDDHCTTDNLSPHPAVQPIPSTHVEMR